MSGDELSIRVRNWLQTQGYPLELSTASLLRQAGFSAVVSQIYDDTETGKPREIDIVAWMRHEAAGAEVRLTLVIECKQSSGNPWVQFVDSPTSTMDARTRRYLLLRSKPGNAFLASLARRRPAIEETALLRTIARPGYGVTAAFSSGTDIAFLAVRSAVNAAMGRQTQSAIEVKEFPIVELIVPVVVFDNRLFEFYVDGNDQVLADTDLGHVVTRVPVGLGATVVHLVPRMSAPWWAHEIAQSFREIVSDCERELELVASKWWHDYNAALSTESSSGPSDGSRRITD